MFLACRPTEVPAVNPSASHNNPSAAAGATAAVVVVVAEVVVVELSAAGTAGASAAEVEESPWRWCCRCTMRLLPWTEAWR